jgi:hypothetical protein
MASFSTTHPYAYHVFPVHAAKSIWGSGSLLSKRDSPLQRRTTVDVDRVLGFEQYVHFYLPRAGATVASLPILETQLKQSGKSDPCPHAVLRVRTDSLHDADCTVCCWNIAVSRPGVPSRDVKGGNWTRGTSAYRILEVWEFFKEEKPERVRARGFWRRPFNVPVLEGGDLRRNLDLLGRARKGCAELLLHSPVALTESMDVIVFSHGDETLLNSLFIQMPGRLRVTKVPFAGYDGPTEFQTKVVSRYFASDATPMPHFDFDAHR